MAIRAIYVHGGVSGSEKPAFDFSSAVAAGLSGVSALDAIEASICVLEDDPSLNAGSGATLTRAGAVELDAGIADGRSGDFGGVAGVRVRHPISLARRVLETTPHALIVGDGASSLAVGMELIEPAEHQLEKWKRVRATGDFANEYGAAEHVETVGAVALDDEGNLAAGSSTGGVFGKMPGRVGDAPVFGTGFYATDRVAVVGTGVGELFLKTLAAARVGDLIEQGMTPQDACDKTIAALGQREPVPAGLLALSWDGSFGASFRGAALGVEGPDGQSEARRLE